MKHFLSILLLAAFLQVEGQNVYIPDFRFKTILLNNASVNTNGDGEIQLSEALAVTDLSINCVVEWVSEDSYYYAPEDLTGIKAFANLQRLSIFSCRDNGGERNIDLDNMVNLRYLKIDASSQLTILTVNQCIALDSLLLYGDYSNPTLLNSLDLNSCINLSHLECFGVHGLRTLRVQECVNLKTIRLSEVVDTLDVSGLMNLEEIEYQSGGYLKADLHGSAHIRSIDATGISILDLNVEGCINLESLNLYAYRFPYSLDLSAAWNLKTLSLGGGNLSFPLRELNIKNGSMLDQFSFTPGLGLYLVCADDFETDTLQRYFDASQQNVLVNSYCNLLAGGHYNTITGNIKLAFDVNGCENTGYVAPQSAIRFTDSAGRFFTQYASATGGFTYYTGKGRYTVMPFVPYPYYAITPSSAEVFFDTANSLVDTINFCIHPDGIHNDAEVTFLPTGAAARPGFNAGYTLVYKNKGSTSLSGTVQLNFDNNKLDFIEASESVSSQSAGQLIWAYNNLLPFESKSINMSFNLLPPPVNNNNDTLTYLAGIITSMNDETPADNSFILSQTVRGSVDPNEKQCLEGSKIDISKIGDYLHYQIHFQNEGTDTAFNIVIADTLSERLDWSSFEFIGSSHSCNAKLTNNKAEFFFPNINLPYKAINEPESDGYAAFKIKPKSSVIAGDSLNNRAAIYFDFNLPVITNKATTVVSNSSSPVPVKLEYFSVNKKDISNVLNWKANCSYGNAFFVIERSNDAIHFISIGNITSTAIRCQLPFNFTDNNPVAGKNYYRLKITDAAGISFYSKILVIGNNNAGLEIKAINGNSIYLNSSRQQTLQLKVIAPDGKIVYSGTNIIVAGNNQLNLQMKGIAADIYTLVVYAGDGNVITKRFVK